MLQPIVEGHGDEKAIPLLLRRLAAEAKVYNLEVSAPIRRKRSELVQEIPLRKVIRFARMKGCRSVLILLDADDDCPKKLAPKMERWARSEASDIHCSVVLAKREFESWFLAAIESLRGKRGIKLDASPHSDPESPRDAKGQLSNRMEPGRSYIETIDQVALTNSFEFRPAYHACRSFRKMVAAFGAVGLDAETASKSWPPDWARNP